MCGLCLTKERVFTKRVPQAFYHGMAKRDVWNEMTIKEKKAHCIKSCADVQVLHQLFA